MKELFSALAKAQGAIKGAVKENLNPHFKSRYADLESVIDAIRQPLSENGLAFIQTVSENVITTKIVHSSGESIESTLPIYGNFTDMQKFSAALTYARRQSLCSAFGVPQVDDDGNIAATAPVAPPVKQGVKFSETGPVELVHSDGTRIAHKPAPAFKPATAKLVKDVEDVFPEYKGAAREIGIEQPLYVEGRDNAEVGKIIKNLNIPAAKVTQFREELKTYLKASDANTLKEAVFNFFDKKANEENNA